MSSSAQEPASKEMETQSSQQEVQSSQSASASTSSNPMNNDSTPIETSNINSNQHKPLPSTSDSPSTSTTTPITPTAATIATAAPDPISKPRPARKRRVPSSPKSILKPSPIPQKTFSFRRDILQSLNSRLAQQGVNVQIPVPNPTAPGSNAAGVATNNVIQAAGGLFRRIGGIAAGVVAPLEESQAQAQQEGKGDRNNDANISKDLPNFPAPKRQDSKNSTLSEESNASTNLNSTLSAAPLKRVQFTITSMSVTYPISNGIAPSEEDFTRIRIEREHRLKLKEWENKKWNVNELESLYRNLCRIREETPLKKMRSVFSVSSEEGKSSRSGLKLLCRK